MRFRYVLGLLLLIPLADALFLVVVADYIGAPATIALVVLTALVGMLLVRAEGRHTLRRLQIKAARGEPPTNELMDGALLIAAGAFLLTPGLVTDALGVLVSIPLTRYPIREALKRLVVVPYLDREMEGFVTGRVWTSGFPDPEEFQEGDGGGRGGEAGFDREAFDGFGSGRRADSTGDDVVDVDFEVDRDDVDPGEGDRDDVDPGEGDDDDGEDAPGRPRR